MKFEKPKKGEKNSHGCIKSFKNTTICFPWSIYFVNFKYRLKNLSYFHNYIIINWIHLYSPYKKLF